MYFRELATRGQSLREFSARIGFDPAHISRICNKKAGLTYTVARNTAAILALPPECRERLFSEVVTFQDLDEKETAAVGKLLAQRGADE